MNEENKSHVRKPAFTEQVARHEARKLKAQSQKHKPLWFGFSITGLVGWGIVIPSLLGLAAGLWIDSRTSGMRWTLMLFALGLIVGCFNAWHWINKESNIIRREEQDEEENTK